MQINKIILVIGIFFITYSICQAQMERERVETDDRIEEVFWAPNLVAMSNVENVGSGSLNVTIMHNFGIATNRPIQNFFGLDSGPNVRLGLDLGITDNWSVGIGRSTFEKIVDFRTKVALLNQSQSGDMPFSVSLKGDIGFTTVENNRPFKDDLNYLLSLPIAKKINEEMSLQFAPMYAHFNTVNNSAGNVNNLFSLALGGEYRLSRRYALMIEYYPVIGDRNPGTTNAFSLGLNIETGGHVFQLYFASSNWHTEQFVIARNTDNFWAGDFRFGFNVNRIFSLGGN